MDEGDLDWLEGIAQQWSRRAQAPHQDEPREIITLTRTTSDMLAGIGEELDSMHRDYMLELCDALGKAAREADIYGEPATARLAFELIGALQNFLPAPEQVDQKSIITRLRLNAAALLVGMTKQAILELVAGQAIRAITDGAS